MPLGRVRAARRIAFSKGELPPSIRMSPFCRCAATVFTTPSTTGTGSMIQTARGGLSRAMNSSTEDVPWAPAAVTAATASALASNTTHSWPCCISRRTMLAPIRPRPIIPSCMALSRLPVHLLRYRPAPGRT